MSDVTSDGCSVLLLGLDGACLSVIEPLIEAGRVPALAALFDRGVVGPLESQLPPWTPSAWPSLYTGVNPGKHGTFDFLTFDGYDWDVVNRTHVREHAIWELLDRQGLSSVVVNVPVTAPPRPFEGALVPGYVGPRSPTCHPEGLLAELDEALGEYRVYAPAGLEGEEQLEWYRRLTRMRGEAFRHLVDRVDPDFGFLQFQQVDTVFHDRPGDDEAVRSVYEAVDREVDAVLEACDPDTVVVASDHGIGPYEGYEFRVNSYLRDRGFLETVVGGEGMPSWGKLSPEDGEDSSGERSWPLLERAIAAAADRGLTSQRIGHVLSRLGLEEFVLRVVPAETVQAGAERVDFAASTAYMRSRTEMGVRLNVAGRDPEGVVSPGEYESVRAEVIACLEEAQTPDGDPVFEAVLPDEEVFSGPYVEDAVDIVTVPAGFDHYLTPLVRSQLFDQPSQPWNHKRNGLVALAGDGVDSDADLGNPHLFDVAPTVLSTLGVPPSASMDGETLPVVSPEPPSEYPPFEVGDIRGTRDRQVEQRLADLGYIDEVR